MGWKRWMYRMVGPVRKAYWFLFRPKTEGVKCIVLDHRGRVALIRNTYGRSLWNMPGGKKEKNESAEQAVEREIFEELGLKIYGTKKLGELFSEKEYKRDTIHCYIAQSETDQMNIDSREILAADWFEIGKLPEEISPIVHRVLSLKDLA